MGEVGRAGDWRSMAKPGAIAEDGGGDGVPMAIPVHCSPEHLPVTRYARGCDRLSLRRSVTFRTAARVPSMLDSNYSLQPACVLPTCQ